MSALSRLKHMAKGLGIDTRAVYQAVSAASLRAALAEQDLSRLVERMREVVPDISDQYTTRTDPIEFARYWEIKTRGMHAFQIQAIMDALDALGRDGLTVVDIGDSSGNHARYLKELSRPGQIGEVVGVNLDPLAVEKIRAKGGKALLCRAEELDVAGVQADLFLLLETLEHFMDPLRFLNKLARQGAADWILFTVPFQPRSRFGGSHLRGAVDVDGKMTAEQVHIWELSPEDWGLLARFAGWKPQWTRIYRQYPRRHPLAVTRPLWRKLDLEGFVAILARRDFSLTDRYADW